MPGGAAPPAGRSLANAAPFRRGKAHNNLKSHLLAWWRGTGREMGKTQFDFLGRQAMMRFL